MDVERYRVPVTMSRLCACCNLHVVNREKLGKDNTPDKLRNELRLTGWMRIKTCVKEWRSTYVMRKVGIHYYHKVTSAEVESMDICSPTHNLTTHSFSILTPSTYPSPSFPARGLRSLTDNESDLNA